MPKAKASALMLLLFFVGCSDPDPWNYPVRLGASQEEVHDLLGLPKSLGFVGTISGPQLELFPRSGVSVQYDSDWKARGLNFKGNYGYGDWITSNSKIVYRLTAKMMLSQYQNRLGAADSIDRTNERFGFATYIWHRGGYLIEGQFWVRDYEEKGPTYPKDSLKWLSVSAALP